MPNVDPISLTWCALMTSLQYLPLLILNWITDQQWSENAILHWTVWWCWRAWGSKTDAIEWIWAPAAERQRDGERGVSRWLEVGWVAKLLVGLEGCAWLDTHHDPQWFRCKESAELALSAAEQNYLSAEHATEQPLSNCWVTVAQQLSNGRATAV